MNKNDLHIPLICRKHVLADMVCQQLGAWVDWTEVGVCLP